MIAAACVVADVSALAATICGAAERWAMSDAAVAHWGMTDAAVGRGSAVGRGAAALSVDHCAAAPFVDGGAVADCALHWWFCPDGAVDRRGGAGSERHHCVRVYPLAVHRVVPAGHRLRGNRPFGDRRGDRRDTAPARCDSDHAGNCG
ncbi:MAG: hypothetical protein AAGJ73_02365 [Pseudomonadota bacterium]